MHFHAFLCIFTHFCCKIVVAINALFPQIFETEKQNLQTLSLLESMAETANPAAENNKKMYVAHKKLDFNKGQHKLWYIHSESDEVCGFQIFNLKKSAEKVRKSRQKMSQQKCVN